MTCISKNTYFSKKNHFKTFIINTKKNRIILAKERVKLKVILKKIFKIFAKVFRNIGELKTFKNID